MIVGAGPAGTATAILLRSMGWRVTLVEKLAFPRQKVCGECLSAASLSLLDRLGLGSAIDALAGPELQQVGWMGAARPLVADLPECKSGIHRYGRALGRDLLDQRLLDHARDRGVTVLQPMRVLSIRGKPGQFECEIQPAERTQASQPAPSHGYRAAVVIDAHGSWSAGPWGADASSRPAGRRSDLFGFKASFTDASLPAGLLPVLSFAGGYGGLVVAEDGRLTLAGCIRRDTLHAIRTRGGGASAGSAFEDYVRRSCPGLQESLEGGQRSSPWLSVGPLRLGVRVGDTSGPLRVGNAAGESHPLIGEGMSMALESAFLLAACLKGHAPCNIDAARWSEVHRAYETAWRAAFAMRRRIAAAYACVTMQPALQGAAQAVLRRWPRVLSHAAHWAGKDRPYQTRLGLEALS